MSSETFKSDVQSKNLNVDEHATPIVKPKVTKKTVNPEKLDELEREILILKRNMPHLRDTQGKDVTNEFVLLREKFTKAEEEKQNAKAEVEYYKKQIQMMGMKDPRLSDIQYEPSLISEFSRVEAGNGDIPKMSMPGDFGLHDEEKNDFLRRIQELEKQLEDERLMTAKKDKAIRGMTKLLPVDLTNADITTTDFEAKEIWVRKLFTDLKSINQEWKTMFPELKEAIKNFVDLSGCERPSILCERLSEERRELEKEVNALESFVDISQQQLSVSFQPQVVVDAYASVDLIANSSITIPVLEEYQNAFATYKRICSGMFGQLQETASFLKKLMDSLESSEDAAAKKLLKKIQELQLGMNTSMGEAKNVMDEVSRTEQSICMILERSMQTSFANLSIVGKNNADIEVLQKEIDRLKEFEVKADKMPDLEEEVRRLKEFEQEVSNLKRSKKDAVLKVKELEKKVEELRKLETDVEILKNYKHDAEKVPTLQAEIAKLKHCEVEARKVPQLETEISKLRIFEMKMGRLDELEKKMAELTEKDGELSKCHERIKYLENVLGEKETQVQKLADENRENKEPLKKFVPAIVDEMNKIYDVLDSVTAECKKIKMSQKSKPKNP